MAVLGLVAAAAWLLGSGRLDGTAPAVSLGVPAGPVGGGLRVVLEASDASPGLARLTVAVDDGPPVARVGPWMLDTRTLADGPHRLTAIAVDASWRGNRTERTARIDVDNTPPRLAVRTTPAAQGRTLALFVATDGPVAEVSARFLDKDRRLYPLAPARWRALVGVAIEQVPGDHPLTVAAEDAAGNRVEHTVPVPVASTPFPASGFIRLTEAQLAAREDDEAIAQMRAERDGAYAEERAEQHWDGPLTLPVQARITSPFGRYRTYNDGRRSHHTGIDLSTRRGTPVQASADGEVLVAGWQAIFGNAVILHHGQGLTSSYNHLDSLSVQAGDQVVRGDEVGTLGSTGQSTGPHVHWSIVVDEVAVDGAQWLDDAFALPDGATWPGEDWPEP